MNAIYRLVWNATAGRWVVASELAKGRSKPHSPFGRALTAVGLLAVAITPFAASAACTGVSTATINCTGSDNGSISSFYAGDISAQLTDWNFGPNSRIQIDAQAPGSSATAVARNVTATGSPVGWIGVLHVRGSGLGANADFTVSDSIIHSGNAIDNHGIASEALNATGSAKSIVTNTNITVDSGATSGRGVITIANGSGGATSTFDGGRIKYHGTLAAIETSSLSGNVKATAHNGGVIDTYGEGAIGIKTFTGAGGTIDLRNGDAITTMGGLAHGMTAGSEGGAIGISNSGAIHTFGDEARGIRATSATGAIAVDNFGAISTEGNGSHAIVAISGGAIFVANSAPIETGGDGAHGILAMDQSASVLVSNDSDITINGGAGANGIRAINSGAGNAEVKGSGDIASNNVSNKWGFGVFAETQAGLASVNYSGDVATYGVDATGLRAIAHGTGDVSVNYTGGHIEVFNDDADGIYTFSQSGNTTISAAGEIIVHGQNDTGKGSHGMVATTAGGNASAAFTGSKIDVDGRLGSAISATSISNGGSGAGDVSVSNAGELIVRGVQGAGIRTLSTTGNHLSVNSGAITTYQNQANGIEAFSTDGNIVMDNSGFVRTQGNNADGLRAQASGAGHVIVANAAAVDTSGTVSNGIRAISRSGDVSVSHGNGSITATAANVEGIRATTSGNANVAVLADGQVTGGSVNGAGIVSGGAAQTITNAGFVGALSDRAAVLDGNDATGVALLTNAGTGTITGTVTATGSTVTVDNAGLWNLRSFADTDGDRVRDALAVAASNFGAGGAGTINNTGTLTLLGDGGAATTLSTSGEYLPLGYSVHAMAVGGAVQGQLLGVQTFNHRGVIDLQANPAVGDVLVISGGQTAGTNGGGVFVSNGGRLKLDTVLNEGGVASQSDLLVVDSTQLGLAPTEIAINNVGGVGALTTQDGIAVVEVLNKDASEVGVFALSGRAVAGAYEYSLFQGGKAVPNDGNWYLRSEAPPVPSCEETNSCPQPSPQPEPACETTSSCPQPMPQPDPVPVYRPEPGAYLGNQVAALGMFQHTLHDRLGEVDFDQRQRGNGDDDRRGAVWTRVVRNQFDATTGSEQIGMSTDSSLLQVGGEFGRWSDGDSRWQIGGMGAIGRAQSNSVSGITGYQAKGKVKGQVVGVYGTWYDNAAQPTGLYVDSWLQYGRFANTVEGDRLARESYDAKGWAASLEAGYAMELGRGERSAFYLEPQAQVVFSDYQADDHVEANGTLVKTGQGGGVTTRLGARAYTRPLTDAQNRVQPFVEANWWHHSDTQSITMSGEAQGLSLSKDVYEVKLGAQAELGQGWTGWGHLGLQAAAGDQHAVEGQLGVKYGW